MKGGYKETEKYWDKVFKQEDLYDPFEKLSYLEIEEAIQWLCKDSDFILDFGCGNGKVLNRCLNYKVKKVYGIDLSEQAINIAKKVVNNNQLQDKCNYLYGGIDLLKKVNDNTYDGVILFNIIDNLKPNDAKFVLKEIYRILKSKGKIILKLNPYFNPNELEKDNNFKKIKKDFYKERSGLYFWNISNKQIKKIIASYYKICKYKEIEFKDYNMINRVYYLKKP